MPHWGRYRAGRRRFLRGIGATALAGVGAATARASGPPSDGTVNAAASVAPRTNWTQQAKIVANDGDKNDFFGCSVAMSGDGTTAIVGAEWDDEPNGEQAGSAYAFVRDGESWSKQAKLAAADGDSEDRFGSSVAVSDDGTTAVVGAPDDKAPNGFDSGSVYVFSRDSGNWTQRAKLAADDGDSRDSFGSSVAVSGDGTTAVVGAKNDEDPNGSGAGSAYVFVRDGERWTQRAKLVADDGDGNDFFGQSVAVASDGTTALVGAHEDEDPNGTRAGSSYVFVRDGGSWTQQAKLAAADGDSNDRFGCSVATSGDGTAAIVGAKADEDPNGEYAGAAYLFTRDGGNWTQRAKLAADDGDSADLFGSSVALSDDGTTALVGAKNDEDPNGSGAGSAYAFVRDGGNWTQRAKLAADDGDDDDFFGESAAMSSDGTTAVVGAYKDEFPNGRFSGSAYVFGATSEVQRTTTSTPPETTARGSGTSQTTVTQGTTPATTTAASQDGTSDGGGTPGFGIGSLLAGLIGAGYLLRRGTDRDGDR